MVKGIMKIIIATEKMMTISYTLSINIKLEKIKNQEKTIITKEFQVGMDITSPGTNLKIIKTILGISTLKVESEEYQCREGQFHFWVQETEEMIITGRENKRIAGKIKFLILTNNNLEEVTSNLM